MVRPVASRALLSTLLLAAGVLALSSSGCAPSPDSPEELFHEFARLNSEGRTGALWDLYTDEARRTFREDIDGMRETLRRNPGAQNLAKQFNVTYEEFLVLPHQELFERENLGRERLLEGAEIVESYPHPQNPHETVVVARLRGEEYRFILVAREVDGEWRVERTQISK